MIFVTSPADIPIIQETLRSYEDASGAWVNTRKSKALALGPWDISLQIMDIPYYNEIRIIGFYVSSTVNAAARRSWYTLVPSYLHKPVTPMLGNSAWTEEFNTYMTI
jgi:hypothetical protein